MALDFSKLNFFSRLDARARVFFVVAAVVAFVLIVYLGTRFIFGSGNTTGPSKVASTPQGLQSVPGGQLNPEYYRALQQANVQSAQQAQLSGSTALPTLINTGGPNANCIVCAEDSANVKNKLDDWVRKGSVSPDVAAMLQQMADKNVSPEDYAAMLDDLVRQGKLTPEQARQLLDEYKKQHKNRLLQDSAKVMDGLIKAGQLPLDAANQLLNSQKNNASPAEYGRLLQNLVDQGKISPATAQQLLAQYAQQRAREITLQSIAMLNQMGRTGELTPDVLKDLTDLENRMVPLDFFSATLDKYKAAGKITPVVAQKVLDEYKDQKAQIGPSQTTAQLLQQAEAAAYQEISDLLKAGKITPDVAAQLVDMLQKNVSVEQQAAVVNQLVQQKKLTPEIAKLKIADYRLVKGLRDLAQQLAELQANNASPNDYANALRNAVQQGLLTPAQAAQLMQEYLAAQARAPLAPGGVGTGEAAQNFAQLQQQLQQGTPTTEVTTPADFQVAQVQATQESTSDRAARLQALMSAMSGQAQQLISTWQPPVMAHREGSPRVVKVSDTKTTVIGGPGGPGPDGLPPGMDGALPSLIKAGTILFAVLDTTVNSDYPTSPVMATVVEGKYKGARLMGKVVTTKSVAGQMDRVSLNFTIMNTDEWPKSKGVNAFAIDPDTARVVMASDVNYHYLKRFGAIMATSFLQGYANAITTSSSTSTTGIFGTSTTHPELDPRSKFLVGLGQVGQTLGNATQNWINIPPTVRVDSGVGLGILFMEDVT